MCGMGIFFLMFIFVCVLGIWQSTKTVWNGYDFHQNLPHDKAPFKFCRTSWLCNFFFKPPPPHPGIANQNSSPTGQCIGLSQVVQPQSPGWIKSPYTTIKRGSHTIVLSLIHRHSGDDEFQTGLLVMSPPHSWKSEMYEVLASQGTGRFQKKFTSLMQRAKMQSPPFQPTQQVLEG